MIRKTICLIIPVLFIFTGCAGTRQIDKASIIESVTVSFENGEKEYTFYLISDSEKVKSTSIKAKNLKNACKIAKEKYIPNVVFDKINLLLFDENVYKDSLVNDIDYITKQSDLSPLVKISISDTKIIEIMKKEKNLAEEVSYHIDNLNKKENKVHIYAFSIFNRINAGKYRYLYITTINNNDEITANSLKILI